MIFFLKFLSQQIWKKEKVFRLDKRVNNQLYSILTTISFDWLIEFHGMSNILGLFYS